MITSEVLHPADDVGFAFLCRTNVRKMKAKTQSRVVQQQKVHRPIPDQRHRDNVPVTPCTSGRAPDQTGRTDKLIKVCGGAITTINQEKYTYHHV